MILMFIKEPKIFIIDSNIKIIKSMYQNLLENIDSKDSDYFIKLVAINIKNVEFLLIFLIYHINVNELKQRERRGKLVSK